MRLHQLVRPRIILELEHADVAVRGRAREHAAGFVGGPGDEVDGGRVDGDLVDALPGVVLLAPDEDFAVVGGGGEDGAVFGMGLVDREC
jgi:hypothetical protein